MPGALASSRWRAPDGPTAPRRGPPAFFDLLHGDQESVALDFADPGDAARLAALVAAADVVIEASRPRALAQLGIDAAAVAAASASVWVSITGYGRGGPAGRRVAFGDDAAVAGGLVAGTTADPVFCADAVADPLSGLAAAAAVVDRLAAGGGWLVDVAMAGVAAWCARLPPPSPSAWSGDVAVGRARSATTTAPALGADTRAVLAELGIP